MDIDFIKWMVGYAEGFEWGKETVTYQHSSWLLGRLHDQVVTWGMYPLILQRAIEGVNSSYFRDHDRYSLKSRYSYDQGKWCYMIIRLQGEGSQTDWYETIDEAKEQALKYIYEQETK